MNKKGHIISIVICIIITFFSVIFFIVKPVNEMKNCTEKAKATIVNVEVYRGSIRDKDDCLNSDHNHSYKYVYSFNYKDTGISGYDYKESQSNTLRHKVGDVVDIRINPDNPEEFMVELGLIDYALMLIPIVFTLFTSALLKGLFKRRK